jgi:DNA-binding PadR family transcriptional regulator
VFDGYSRRGGFSRFFGAAGEHGRVGPWGFRRRFFEPGEVRIALLSLLKDSPKHGYELMKELETRSGGTYRASAGSVYPNLQLLEDEGLIKADVKEDGKRVFTITDAGLAELAKQKDAADRVWSRASAWDDWSEAMSPAAMEVLGPGMRLVRSAFRAAAHGDAKKIDSVRGVLTRAREEIERMERPAATS